jgi:hypothetical protein
MSLSARIAVGPSRRIALMSTVLPIGGVVVCAVTLALRWPAVAPLSAIIAVAAGLSLVLHIRRRPGVTMTLFVSHRADFAVEPDPTGVDGSWHLAESTLVWPGFSMLALRSSGLAAHDAVLRLPIFAVELATADRRALSRFLLWSLRAGSTDSRA